MKNNINSVEVIDKFLDSFIKYNDRTSAYREKHKMIPNRLFKYMPIKPTRLDTIKKGNIFLATYEQLNDPYDINAFYYNEEEIVSFVKGKIPKEANVSEWLKGLNEIARKNTVFSCAQEKSNMQLWAHYGDNHKGMCVEYDFTKLPTDHLLSEMLFPVGYEDSRYDATNLIKMLFENALSGSYDPRLRLIFLFSLFKETKWSYENEWRIVIPILDGIAQEQPCPILPTAIYLGKDCTEENADLVKSQLPKIPIYKLDCTNEKSFGLSQHKL